MRRLRHLLWIALLSVMAAIYLFSSQPASESNETSKKTTEIVVDTWPLTKDLPLHEKLETVDGLNSIVRKYAHFALFFLLGIVAVITFYYCLSFKSILQLWICALILCLLYAVSDEVHQLFVEGRSAQIIDVIIDFTGSFAGSAPIAASIAKYKKLL